MLAYQIEYTSISRYEFPVSEAVFELNVMPCNNHHQSTYQSRFRSSFKENGFTVKNAFGFETQRFRTSGRFQEVEFTLQALVHKEAQLPSLYADRTAAQEWESLRSTSTYLDHYLFLEQSTLTKSQFNLPEDLAQMVGRASVLETLQSLSEWIHRHMRYQKDVTTVQSSAEEAYALGAGVCQDFTHIFLSLCRRMGVPCRYVSGYLNQDISRVGNAFMHAWAEAWIPGLDWIGFDPTNNLLADGHYLKVCHGCDYMDCAPIKGVLRTNGKQESEYHVSVHRL